MHKLQIRGWFAHASLYDAPSKLDIATEDAALCSLKSRMAGCTTIAIARRLIPVMHANEIVVLEAGRTTRRIASGAATYADLWHRT